MDYEDDILLDIERFEPGIQKPLMVDEAVIPFWRRSRIAHADIVRRQTAPERHEMRNDVPPKIGRRWVAVQKHDRIARADVDIGHLRAEYFDVFPVGNFLRGDGGM